MQASVKQPKYHFDSLHEKSKGLVNDSVLSAEFRLQVICVQLQICLFYRYIHRVLQDELTPFIQYLQILQIYKELKHSHRFSVSLDPHISVRPFFAMQNMYITGPYYQPMCSALHKIPTLSMRISNLAIIFLNAPTVRWHLSVGLSSVALHKMRK